METEESDSTVGLDVIVVNYRTSQDLQKFISSVIEFAPDVPFRFTAVNVKPDYDSYRIGEYCRRTGLTHIWHNENIGYGRAVNHAVSRTGKEIVAIFNADTYFTSNILDECYEALKSHDDWAVLGPRQVNESGLITSGGIGGDEQHPHLRNWLEPDVGQATGIDEVLSVSGSAYFIKRNVWNEITAKYQSVSPLATGAFLETRHYYEESFCSYISRSLGYKNIYQGNVSMVHKWHSASAVGSEVDQKMPESRALFRETCDKLRIPHD